MSKLLFGRDRIPEPWTASAATAPECKPGNHLLDQALERCTVCGWVDPETPRCATVGCPFPADYEVEVERTDDPDHGEVIVRESFCDRHAWLGGLALLPHGELA